MILRYIDVYLESLTSSCVSVDAFNRQMAALQSYDVVYLDEYDPQNCNHAVITFDGVSKNIVKFALPILKKWGYPFECFIIGDYIGKTFSFNSNKPSSRLANLNELKICEKYGAHIQWLLSPYKKLSELSQSELRNAIVPDENIKLLFNDKNFQWLASSSKDYIDAKVLVNENFKGVCVDHITDCTDERLYTRIDCEEDLDLFQVIIMAILLPKL